MKITRPTLAAACLAAPALAQVPTDATPSGLDVEHVRPNGSSVALVDGLHRGFGPDYKVEFHAGRVEYVPALGDRAERNQPVSIALDSVFRGGAPRWTPSIEGQPQLLGTSAVYQRGGVRELWETSEEGLSFSFLIEAPVQGDGDLVVRTRLETPLQVPLGAHQDGLALRLDGETVVTIGDVTGIDADGRRVSGSLVTDGTHLDLVLPDAFVDAASWPVLVDPIVATPDFPDDGFTYFDADVSFDSSAEEFVIVYGVQFSGLDVDIRGVRVQSNGNVVPGFIAIESDQATTASSPSIGFNNNANRHMVSWSQNSGLFTPNDIVARSLFGPSSSLSAVVTVAATSANEIHSDVGGNRRISERRMLVVWEQDGAGIRAARYDIAQDGSLNKVGFTIGVANGPEHESPAISKSGGEAGRWMVTWTQQFPSDRDVLYRLYDLSLNPLTGAEATSFTIGPDESAPAVDGDGARFVVVCQREDGPSQPATSRIVGRRIHWNGTALVEQPEQTFSSSGATAPDIAWDGFGWQLAYNRQEILGFAQVANEALDAITLNEAYYGGTFSVTQSTFVTPRLATEYHGGKELNARGMQVWTESDGDVFARLLANTPTWGTVEDACGEGGTARSNYALIGQDLQHELVDAAPISITLLTVGFARLDFPCGTCNFVPDTGNGGLILGGLTGADGGTTIDTPIPDNANLVGLNFWTQWATFSPSPVCSLVGVDVSSALEYTVGD